MSSAGGRPPSDDEIAEWLSYTKNEKAVAVSGGRRLTPTEKDLWESYVADGQIPPPEKAPVPQRKLNNPQSRAKRHATAPFKIESFEIGSKASLREGDAQTSEGGFAIQMHNYQLDGKIRKRLLAGKIQPESKLDLHGMNQEEAKRTVARFVLSSYGTGKRLILIVTGKGREKNDAGPIPQRTGILRRSLQTWLDAPPIKDAVQYVSPAHDAHGGSGAFYVYLRRRKKIQSAIDDE